MEINRSQVERLLVEEWDYKDEQVDEVASKLTQMDPRIQEGFQVWMKKRAFPAAPVFHGFHPANVDELYPLKPPAVFLLLDWIRREPLAAQKALKEEYGILPSNRTEANT